MGAKGKKGTEARRPGRPRSEEARQAILRAAYHVLKTRGWRAATADAIASEAGVSKATMYRWWSCKASVVMDGYLEAVQERLPFPNEGSVVQSFRVQMKRIVDFFQTPDGRLIAVLVAAAQDDPEVALAFRERFLVPRREAAREVLEASIEAGELDPSVDLDVLIDTLYAPLYYRLLMGHSALDHEFVDTLVEHVFRGLLDSGTQSKSQE